ncbi:membrane protein [Deinococcus radiopugnans]|uniref:Membrane protein n=2 Tax=Deinococcus radiopugnans TaxID=57497 RepID=A0A0A7KGZ8_9DEIO|nr:OmpH family outer membrane protein [Deinococcus radiopugnans]AIZ45406.1 membrane protein [Deinococcus radiopugnans]MBB6016519.1 outer membrane protein [Deinococcus radiopugnans ATCC 19172]QLG10422.1 OmpH family outer membrane protein [Deinococcus sp. D7000]TNM71146.1 OmpH family outer membrane protein [Deinococcus radiopugnans ATCC 19172]
MKITAKTLAPFAVVAAFGLGTLAPHAQTTPQKIGFVDVSKLLAAHPNDKDIKAIQTKADAELGALDKQVKAIDAKGASATAAEKQQRETLVKTIQSKAADYDKQIDPKITAVEKSVDAAVSSVAKANGYSVVMDKSVAANGLVIYADPSTELTDAALKAVKP